MTDLRLFTDGSMNPQSKVGYGAYLVVPEAESFFESLNTRVKVKRFDQTSSTKLELQTLLWALTTIQISGCKVMVFTDSQNIIGLLGRRARLEQNDYQSKKNKRIKNYKLYQEFFKIVDQLDCEFVKVKGHKVSHQKDQIDKFFTLVDKASRKALRHRETHINL
ncbi:MAG: ribonuclease H [Desulfobacteraceae bacterium]|nr:ribonuclease H [Desulfobacteraceae bacterium]